MMSEPLPPEDIHDLFQRIVDGREFVDTSPLLSENYNRVIRLHRAADTDLVVKFCVDTDWQDEIVRDCCLQRYLAAESNVSVPVVVDSGVVGDEDAYPYFVTQLCEGSSLASEYDSLDDRAREDRLYEIGRTLAHVHQSTSFDAPGWIEPNLDGTLEVDDRQEWKDVLYGIAENKVKTVAGTRFESASKTALEFVESRLDILEQSGPPVVIHGELERDNVIFGPGGEYTFIDWEYSMAAPGEYDLCWAESGCINDPRNRREASYADALFAGYREVRTINDGFYERRQLYRVITQLDSMVWFDSWIGDMPHDEDTVAKSLLNGLLQIMKE